MRLPRSLIIMLLCLCTLLLFASMLRSHAFIQYARSLDIPRTLSHSPPKAQFAVYHPTEPFRAHEGKLYFLVILDGEFVERRRVERLLGHCSSVYLSQEDGLSKLWAGKGASSRNSTVSGVHKNVHVSTLEKSTMLKMVKAWAEEECSKAWPNPCGIPIVPSVIGEAPEIWNYLVSLNPRILHVGRVSKLHQIVALYQFAVFGNATQRRTAIFQHRIPLDAWKRMVQFRTLETRFTNWVMEEYFGEALHYDVAVERDFSSPQVGCRTFNNWMSFLGVFDPRCFCRKPNEISHISPPYRLSPIAEKVSNYKELLETVRGTSFENEFGNSLHLQDRAQKAPGTKLRSSELSLVVDSSLDEIVCPSGDATDCKTGSSD